MTSFPGCGGSFNSSLRNMGAGLVVDSALFGDSMQHLGPSLVAGLGLLNAVINRGHLGLLV